jgi:AcrR family transcriptional regulator
MQRYVVASHLVNSKIAEYSGSVPKRETGARRRRPYHHGNLRRALLDEAIEVIGEGGAPAISLRDLARRVGVSHAAPAHHFGDKRGLLTAVAAEGYRLFAAALRDEYERSGSFRELGVAYVRFAVEHRPYFEVMFRPELYHTENAELVAAREEATAVLSAGVGRLSGGDPKFDTLRAGVASWSLVHGLATLYLNRALPPELGDDPEEIARTIPGHFP